MRSRLAEPVHWLSYKSANLATIFESCLNLLLDFCRFGAFRTQIRWPTLSARIHASSFWFLWSREIISPFKRFELLLLNFVAHNLTQKRGQFNVKVANNSRAEKKCQDKASISNGTSCTSKTAIPFLLADYQFNQQYLNECKAATMKKQRIFDSSQCFN